jgi:predicted metal-dependent peptidase
MAVSVLTRAKAQLVLQEPFYATILLNLKVVETDKTNGRPLWMVATDGANLYVNPANFETLSVAEAKGALKHEVMHIAGMHLWRGGGKEADRWNQACDYSINPIILDEGGALPSGVLDGTPFKGMSAEQIYKILPPSPPKDPNAPRDPNGNPLDDDMMPPQNPGASGEAAAKVMVAQAAAVAKAQGKLPGSLKELVDSVMRPTVDWKEQLQQFLTEIEPADYSFARCNRRFIAGDASIYLPGMSSNDSMRELGYVNDTSGSISLDEMRKGLGEIGGAVEDVKPSKLIVAHCDSKVQHHEVFDHPSLATVTEKLERHGGGGTNMPAALTWFTRKFPNVQAVIVFTDGETPFGSEDDYPFPVLWAITSKRITAPWGTTVHVELDG